MAHDTSEIGDAGIPMKPAELAGRESELWDQYARIYHAAGVLYQSDGLTLASLCEARAIAETARANMRAGAGATAQTKAGKSTPSGEYKVWKESTALVRQLTEIFERRARDGGHRAGAGPGPATSDDPDIGESPRAKAKRGKAG